MDPAHIALDDGLARDVLEDEKRERKIELRRPAEAEAVPPFRADYGKILAIIPKYVSVGKSNNCFPGLTDHFAADIDGKNLAEESGKSASYPSRAAADLEHAHLLGIPALADVAHVV